MATINHARLGDSDFLWETITGSDVGSGVKLKKGGGQIAVYAAGTWSTGTITLQGSIDGSTWFGLLTSPGGSAVTFTADGYAEISTAVRYIRPSADASITDVDVQMSVTV